MTAANAGPRPQLWLVRHGQTDWSRSGRHTSRTELALTPDGRREARAVRRCLRDVTFSRVRSSPALRAIESVRLAGFGEVAETTPDLREWEYGDYEGLTTAQIRTTVPGWTIWTDGAPGGETPNDVVGRADRVIAEAIATPGLTLLVAHAHILRVLTARWLGLPAADGRLLVLGTGTVSILGWEREQAAIVHWNERCGTSRDPSPEEAGQRTTRTEQGAS